MNPITSLPKVAVLLSCVLFALTGCDGGGGGGNNNDNGDSDRSNTAPVAKASGPDAAVAVGATVRLDGGKSTDPDDDTLTYKWSWLKKPSGSSAELIGVDAVKPGFTADAPGDYEIQLIVNDGQIDSAPAKVAVSTENVAPVADAGANRTVAVGATVQLNGGGSSDADGDSITYQWTLSDKPSGSAASLSNSTAKEPTFVADKPGAYTVTLVVNDGQVDSDPATVTISTRNVPPVANAGPDRNAAKVNTVITLDGSNSTDLDGDLLRYQWKIINPSAGVSLFGADSVKPGFQIDAPGDYKIQLIVNDGQVDSSPDTVMISTENVKPVANAGADRSVDVGATAQLDGGGSTDADGDPLTYRWTLKTPSGSSATLAGADSATPSFVVDAPGSYEAQLIVNDGQIDSDPASVVISTINVKPVANAGPNQTAKVGAVVQLDGSKSTDADKDSLTYRWSLTAKPGGSGAVLLGDNGAVNPGFKIDKPGDYVAQLIVNDGQVDSEPATVTISTQNTPPVADAGPDQPLPKVNETIELDGSASADVDDDPLTYRWSWLSRPPGSNAALLGVDSVNPGFVADVPGPYIAQLIVNDGQVDSAPATVTITTDNLKPIADAGFPQTIVTVGSTAQLNGANSSDPESQPLTYRWSLTKPADSAAALQGADTTTPSFVVDVAGDYVAQLIVNDGVQDSEPDTVLITRSNLPPIANAGPDKPVETIGPTVEAQLDGGLSSDPNNDPLTYRWSLLSKPDGSQATLVNPNTQTPTLRSIDRKGRYIAQLTVNDGYQDSDPPDTVVVQAPEPISLVLRTGALTVGKNLQLLRQILLEIPAPSGGTTVKLTSEDPAKVKLSDSPTTMGGGVLNVAIPPGESFSQNVYFQAFADSGRVNVTAEAPGYPTGTIRVDLARSSVAIQTPSFGMPVSTLRSVGLQLKLLDSNGKPGGAQYLGPDLTVSVNLSNSNSAVGNLTNNPVVFTEGQLQATTPFRSTTTGSTIVSIISQPEGFYPNPAAEQSIVITVQPAP